MPSKFGVSLLYLLSVGGHKTLKRHTTVMYCQANQHFVPTVCGTQKNPDVIYTSCTAKQSSTLSVEYQKSNRWNRPALTYIMTCFNENARSRRFAIRTAPCNPGIYVSDFVTALFILSTFYSLNTTILSFVGAWLSHRSRRGISPSV